MSGADDSMGEGTAERADGLVLFDSVLALWGWEVADSLVDSHVGTTNKNLSTCVEPASFADMDMRK